MTEVLFRKLKDSDAAIIYEWISNPELRRMIGTRGVPSIQSHQIWFNKKKNDSDNIIYIIEYNSVPVGLIGTNVIDRCNNYCEMYLYIGSDQYKGCGIGYFSVISFVKELFTVRGYHKICARIFSYNKPSIKLFEKCGFILEGIQKEQICINKDKNQYCDLLWYGLINAL